MLEQLRVVSYPGVLPKSPGIDVSSKSSLNLTHTYLHNIPKTGTKHIDPDTGLIYFKYDFGYEFGVILPGEGKKTVSSASKSIRGQRRASDIDVPIIHEFTTKKETTTTNGFSRPSSQKFEPGTGGKFQNSKSVKWGEPTSESEFSEAEDSRSGKVRPSPGFLTGKNLQPPSVAIPQSNRWLADNTPSPVSLSPSIPSLSPHQSSLSAGPPSNVDSTGREPRPRSEELLPPNSFSSRRSHP